MTVPDHRLDAPLIEELLTLPTPERQEAFLEARGLLNPDGLDRLLDHADRLVNDDPGKARRIAELCAKSAERAGAPTAVPRASYVLAGTCDAAGEYDAELRLIKAAHDGYAALGKNLEALRTNVGLMGVLLDLGRYREALDAGQIVLDTLDGRGELAVGPTAGESALLTALVQQNRGLCFEHMGRYDEALDAYAIAEERYRTIGETERLGEILDNRGAILLYLGRGGEALAAHETAAAIFEEAGLALSHARALSNIGETCLCLGNYRRGLDALHRAHSLLDSLGALADKHLLLRYIANAYLELNLYSEALAAYKEANEWLREAGIAHGRAQVLWGMGAALAALSDLEEAERALAGAAEKFAAAGNLPMLSGVMLEQASLMAAREDRGTAVDTARRALELVSRQDRPVEQVYAHLRLADLLDTDDAEPYLLAAQRLARRLALPHLRYRLNERLGHLRRLQGNDDEARVLLEAAVEEIERLRGTVAQETMRASFLRDKMAAYEDLLLLHLAREDAEASRYAFNIAEKAKSRALVDLLTGVVEGALAADTGLEERLQELQADLNATYNRMLGVAGEDEIPLPDLRKRAVELEREISRLRLQAAATSDPFTVPVSTEAVQERLPSDVTLLAYHIAGEEIMAFITEGDGIRVVRNLGSAATVAKLLRRLDLQWDRFRPGPEFVGRNMALLERSARDILARLYSLLVAPLETLLDRSDGWTPDENVPPRKLVVVPHGLLHRVPFHALFDGERYLLERFEISYAPSATVYALCQDRKQRGFGKSLVVSVADPLAPAVTEEARAVARHLLDAEVLSDGRATTEALQNLASGRNVLHLACHGLFRSDNPMFSSLKLHDGWLTAVDVMRLDLAGALVTLSACESGRNEVFAGDELLGLTRAFLGTGASTLAVSLWVVQDETTASLMERYYERLGSGAGPAEALRAAQLELKDEHPHPYYWAPFVLIGQRTNRADQP